MSILRKNSGVLKIIFPRNLLLVLMILSVPVLSWADVASLTQQERDWLKAHPVIRIGIDGAYAPYSFTDSDNQFVGVAPDILHLIEERLGIRFEPVPDLSWPEIVAGARQRSLDVIATAVITEERKTFLNFSQIYIPTPLVIMTRQTEDRVHSPADLKHRTVALVKGYSSSQRVMDEHPDAITHMVDTAIDGLRAVAVGDADAYVGVLGINVYLASKYGITNLRIAGKYDVETNGQRFGVRNDWPELVSILDKALNAIPETEKLEILKKWIPVPSLALLSKEQIIILVMVLVFVVLLLGITWIWVLRRQGKRLAREVRGQTRALHESERRLELAIQGGGMAAWDIDFKTKEMIVSQGWWSLMGLPERKDGNPREAWLRHIHADDLEHVLAKEADFISGKLDRYEVEYRIVTQEGKINWQVIRGSVVDLRENENSAHAVGLIQDITEHKKLDEIKNEFVSSVSHELRTPLTSIKGSLGLLAGGAMGVIPEKAQEILNIAYQNSERLNLLINDLLDMQKLQSGKVEFQMRPLVIKDLIIRALSANQGYADKYKVHFSWDPSEADEVTVNGDEHRLLQVFANLLSNAIKFSPPGEEVKISTSIVNRRVRVSVSDNGAGIPIEFKRHVFERFSQADSTDSKGKSGTGLGLAITKEIIERHNGVIGFENMPQSGAMFYFELPAQ